jgi:hypothetical protein
MGASIAERSRKLLENSPAIVILGTKSDKPADWLAVGPDFSRHVEKVLKRFLSTPIFPLPIVINLILLRMSLWKKLRSLVG